MATQLENDLKFLLSLNSIGDYIDVDKILEGKKTTTDNFYENFYTRPIKKEDWGLNQDRLDDIVKRDKKHKTIDWNIRNIKPFYENFTVEKFWFKNSDSEDNPYKDLKAEAGSVIGFKDGINTIFYQGDYLDGGDVYYTEETSDYYKQFIYAYFPPKLYLSQNSKSYFILTQGKHLLRNREQAVVRFYFNLKPKADAIDTTSVDAYEKSIKKFKQEVNDFVNEIEWFLNNRRIPFQFKLPISLENFRRADTFVLYIAQKHYYYLYEFIKKLSKDYIDILGEETPLFTAPFAGVKGISIAEDPDVFGDSFGMNRCTLVYEIIENLSKNLSIKDKMTIENVITELQNKGYALDNEFYRTPYTKFNYDFTPLDIEINLPYSYPKKTKFYLYVYGRVALNYALDLIEKAIWLNQTDLTWLTYYEKDNEKGYRLVNDKENKEKKEQNEVKLIFWYLEQILKFPWMRKKFPDHIQRIIINKNNEIREIEGDDYLESLKTTFEEIKIEEESIKIQASAESVKPPLFFSWGNIESNLENFTEYLDTVLGIPEENVESSIYKVPIGQFGTTSDLIKDARKIYYQYLKPRYPMKNAYGNYEYVPTNKGKLQIAMIMLYVYCPSIFKDLEGQPKVSLQKSLFRKVKSKLQFRR